MKPWRQGVRALVLDTDDRILLVGDLLESGAPSAPLELGK